MWLTDFLLKTFENNLFLFEPGLFSAPDGGGNS